VNGRVRLRGFTAKRLNVNSPGLSDEGALPRVDEIPPTAVRGRMLEDVARLFRTEGTNHETRRTNVKIRKCEDVKMSAGRMLP
jgi:hypothetical protein